MAGPPPPSTTDSRLSAAAPVSMLGSPIQATGSAGTVPVRAETVGVADASAGTSSLDRNDGSQREDGWRLSGGTPPGGGAAGGIHRRASERMTHRGPGWRDPSSGPAGPAPTGMATGSPAQATGASGRAGQAPVESSAAAAQVTSTSCVGAGGTGAGAPGCRATSGASIVAADAIAGPADHGITGGGDGTSGGGTTGAGWIAAGGTDGPPAAAVRPAPNVPTTCVGRGGEGGHVANGSGSPSASVARTPGSPQSGRSASSGGRAEAGRDAVDRISGSATQGGGVAQVNALGSGGGVPGGCQAGGGA